MAPVSLVITFLLTLSPWRTLALQTACQSTCGSLPVKYPLGTGYGCGSPRFYPFVTCAPSNDQLLLNTHTGSYPITSISYATSTLTVTPPLMSNCSCMRPSPNFGLDWTGPFQIGPSVFILLSCASPTSSFTLNGTPICDNSNTHLCASIYTCPSVVSLGLPLFSSTDSCCVYSPANLNPKGDLDLNKLKCAGYASVASLGDFPTDPSRWVYGVVLEFNQVGFDNYNLATGCEACEKTGGVCGYAPPQDYFVCICKNGVNTSTDCYGQLDYWVSGSTTVGILINWRVWLGSVAVLALRLMA